MKDTKAKIRKQDALDYHMQGRPGKIEVVPTKDTKSQRDLALAYSPGVAEPCLEIAKDVNDVYKYTAKGNLVGVISNGTAVLGLGDIGPEASKPVMEGKGLLFKIFAGIDVFDIELNAKDPEEFIRVVKAMEPTFGGINLEDIGAPECFEIEERLKKEMNIPIMHDDQHGTAIISAAGLLNAVELLDKNIDELKVVVSGAGAAAISCVKLFIRVGVKKENIILCDSRGAIRKDREGVDGFKKEFATAHDVHSLEEAMVGSDVFLGLSKGNLVTPDMLLSMNKKPIVFALANPEPEIGYKLALQTRDDLIMATGRSDHPNQINNVLGFPFIFRGAMDVRATEINEEMKLACVYAIANLAKEPVPDLVIKAYNKKTISFGKDYIIPKPLDTRLLLEVAPAVAKAAMESGVAKFPVRDWDRYKLELKQRLGKDENVVRLLASKARQDPKKVVFAEAENYKILKAAQTAMDEGIAYPILLGNKKAINKIIEERKLDLHDIPIIDPKESESDETIERYAKVFFEKRHRKGYNMYEARDMMRRRNYFGSMMVELGDADAMISGLSRKYQATIKPALEIIGSYKPGKKICSMYLMFTQKGPLFLTDTTIIPNPTAQDLADIAKNTARAVSKYFNLVPKVAMLSYSNFGSANGAEPKMVQEAVRILKEKRPDLIVDGEIQANIVFNQEAMKENYPFSSLLDNEPNILVFPNLSAANISYKLLQTLGGVEAIGPILLGLRKPVHVLQLGTSVKEIVDMVTIATIDAQIREEELAKMEI